MSVRTVVLVSLLLVVAILVATCVVIASIPYENRRHDD